MLAITGCVATYDTGSAAYWIEPTEALKNELEMCEKINAAPMDTTADGNVVDARDRCAKLTAKQDTMYTC